MAVSSEVQMRHFDAFLQHFDVPAIKYTEKQNEIELANNRQGFPSLTKVLLFTVIPPLPGRSRF